MLFAFILQISTALAASPQVRINFTSLQGEACEIALQARIVSDFRDLSDRYLVRRLVVPGLPSPGLGLGRLFRLVPGSRGDAEGLRREHFEPWFAEHMSALEEMADDDSHDPVVVAARGRLSAADREVVRAARDFAAGHALGRAFRITAHAIGRDPTHVAPQLLFLVLPEATYPRGVLVASDSPHSDTWAPLVTHRWPEHPARAAIIIPATITEKPHRRGATYMVPILEPLPDLEDLKTTSEIISF